MEAASYYHHGIIIREARQAAHMTQEQLAEVWPKADGGVGVSWHYVQDVEYGKKFIESASTLRRLAAILAIPLWKFGLSDYDPFDAQHASEQGKSAHAGGEQGKQRSAQLDLNAGSEAATMHQEGDAMDKVTRRQALEVGAEVGATALLLPPVLNADEADRLSWLVADAKALDTTALSSLEHITQSYWPLVYSSVPKHGLLKGVLGHLESVEHFLRTVQSTTREQRLCVLVSQQAQMAGEIYFDMHDYPQAEQYHKMAIEAARHSANPALYAVAVARTSFVYAYNHQYQEALSLLQVARRFAGQSPTIHYWIAAAEAEFHARMYAREPDLSTSHASLQALEEAEHILDQPDEDPYWTVFGPARWPAYKGASFRHLRRLEEAEAALLEALATTNIDVPSGQAITLVDLAGVYVQQGEIEEACKRATQALMITNSQTKSANTLQRVSDFRRELEPWASRSDVQKLDEQIMVVRLHLGVSSLTKKE
ncbi:MAG: helix-turn-helix transcriptional regulator [Ktedonobacteraceae bacterium]|nr:helix-turn-helix transcriptional regulator [Ktedonobacteraceae bacterium]